MPEAKPKGSPAEKKPRPFPTDPYEALGISIGATSGEIKKAYKKLALQYHPDQNPGDKEAEEWFKMLAEAKDILLHPGKNSYGKNYFTPEGRARAEKERQEREEAERLKREAEAEKLRQEQEKKDQEAREKADRERNAQENKLRDEIRSMLRTEQEEQNTGSAQEMLQEEKLKAEIRKALRTESMKEKVEKKEPAKETKNENASGANLSEDQKKAIAEYKATILAQFKTASELKNEISRKEAVLETHKKNTPVADDLEFAIKILKEVLVVLEKNEARKATSKTEEEIREEIRKSLRNEAPTKKGKEKK